MYYFVIFLASLAVTNTLSHSQQWKTERRSATDDAAELCELPYEKHPYAVRLYGKYRTAERDRPLKESDDELYKAGLLVVPLEEQGYGGYETLELDRPLDRVHDYDKLSYELRRELALKKALATAEKIRQLKALSGAHGVIDIHNDGNEGASDARMKKRRLGAQGTTVLWNEGVPRTEGATALSARYPLRITKYPLFNMKTIEPFSPAEENDEDTSVIDDSPNEPRLIDSEDNVDKRDKNNNVNRNVNINSDVDQSGISDLPDGDSYHHDDGRSNIGIENEETLSIVDTQEVLPQGVENGKTVETDFTGSSDLEKNSTVENFDDLLQPESNEGERTLMALEHIVTTVIPEINVAERVPSNTDNNGKRSKKNHNLKYRERLRRKKDKKRLALLMKKQLTLEDQNKGEELKEDAESPELKVEVPDDSWEAVPIRNRNGSLVFVDEPSLKANVNGSLGSLKKKIGTKEVVTPSRDNDDLGENNRDREHKTNDQEDKLEGKKLSKDSRAVRKQNYNKNSNRNVNVNRRSAPSFRHPKARKIDFKYPQIEDSDLTEDLKETEEDLLPLGEHEKSKSRKINHLQKNIKFEGMRMPSLTYVTEPDRIARSRNSNVNKNKNVNYIGDPSRIPQSVEPVELANYRRSSKSQNFNKNVNRNGNTNVNKNKIRASGTTKFVHRDDVDDGDERLDEIKLNRRNLNQNVNKNENYNVNKRIPRASFEESNGRVYEIMSNRRTLERRNLDGIESDEIRNINRNDNKNINENHNVNRLSNPHIPRRVERGKLVKISQKAVQEINQRRKPNAEKDAESNDVSDLEHRRALFHVMYST